MGVEIFLAGSALTPAPGEEGGDTGDEEEEAGHGHHHRHQAGTLARPPSTHWSLQREAVEVGTHGGGCETDGSTLGSRGLRHIPRSVHQHHETPVLFRR